MQFSREWTTFAVRFREVSGLESVRLERVDCNVKLYMKYGHVYNIIIIKITMYHEAYLV